jgi:hypothetical protein
MAYPERSFKRRAFETVTAGAALVTIPLALSGGIAAMIAGEFLVAGLAGTSLMMDRAQLLDYGKPVREKRWYNPDRWLWGRIFPENPRGSQRFQNHFSSLVHTTT